MSRKVSINAPGALHHIIIRGIERKVIFKDSQDYSNFLNRLRNVLTETKTPCFAWGLACPNHEIGKEKWEEKWRKESIVSDRF